MESYDVVVIGSGQGGGPIASEMARAGQKTALIERTHVGGTCVNEGCTPTKTMVASARVAYLARRAADYGVHTGPISIDMAKVRERKRERVESSRSGSEQATLAIANLDLIYGEGRFTGPNTVEIALNDGSTRTLQAGRIIINTGARPTKAQIEGIEQITPLDSTSIMELDSVPEHLVVIGGGYISLEFGQMFRRFGSAVTIIQRGHQLLEREDHDVAQEVADILREDGIDILLDATATHLTKTEHGFNLTVDQQGGKLTLAGTHLLVAAGRTPNTEALTLEQAGVECDAKGFVKVNDKLETNVPGIYAVGDVKGGPAFTHISYDDFRILRTNLLQGGDASIADRMVPYTVYIDPQLGRIGINEEEARKAGRNVKVAKMPMTWVARALEVDETRGFMKAVVDADSGQILGYMMLGLEGGEIMTIVQVAMMGKLPYTVLRDATIAHPTLAEALNNLFTQIDE